MDKKWLWLLGGLSALWLLRKSAGAQCPNPDVLHWTDLAKKVANRFEQVRAEYILAAIQDQSQGNPSQTYYIGGVWPRYGLMGVPLSWAQEMGFSGEKDELLRPDINIEYGTKILFFMNAKILKAYRGSGINVPTSGGISANAYSWYTSDETLTLNFADDPKIHQRDIINRYINLVACYRDSLY